MEGKSALFCNGMRIAGSGKSYEVRGCRLKDSVAYGEMSGRGFSGFILHIVVFYFKTALFVCFETLACIGQFF